MSEIVPEIAFFPTFEEREQAFISAIGGLVPRRYAGPSVFFRDFMSIISRVGTAKPELRRVFITANPQDCLAFGTASQVLRAAHLTGGTSGFVPVSNIRQVLEMFSLQHIAHQPIRTLSGGETVLLALAKAYIASRYARALMISSPFSWLSPQNVRLLDKVVAAYREDSRPVEILALAGENSIESLAVDPNAQVVTLPFLLSLRGVLVELEDTMGPDRSRGRFARFLDSSLDLKSPCLIVGDNGSGKSLAACVLSRAIPFRGTATLRCRGRIGRGRLLFQDVINQTLMRSFKQITRGDNSADSTQVIDMYRTLVKEFVGYFERGRRDVPLISCDDQKEARSLLEIKMLLVASRIAVRPCAIILDEPEWGFCRDAAEGLVVATTTVAHELGVPVLIISHKPWWNGLAASTVTVTKRITPEKNLEISLNSSGDS